MRVNREGLKKQVHVKLEREYEDRDFRTEIEDQQTVEWIRSELQQGNSWAWCSAKVTVSFLGLSSEQYLGGCSYQSRADFEKCDYYDSLVDDGVDEIADALERVALDHRLWVHDPVLCVWCVAEGS